MHSRRLGRSGIEISAMGMGCWAIGGPFWKNGQPVGWGQVNDEESMRAIQCALDLGISFFDTAGVYGCGHSEIVLGKALARQRDRVVIATKFGQVFDEETRQVRGYDTSPEQIRLDCEESLRRLKTDQIDLFQLHVKDLDVEHALVVQDTLEDLVQKGKIRFYGWSTDDPESSRLFAQGPHCTAIQQQLNVFEGNPKTLEVCEQFNLASINRGPLNMGLLTGKFTREAGIPKDDVRSRRPAFQEDRGRRLDILDRIRGVLVQDGRTLAQGALGWIWARSQRTIPIPGFKTIAQVEENSAAMNFGPLTEAQMEHIAELLVETPPDRQLQYPPVPLEPDPKGYRS
jgi:aryl-alcohol dehydrogenase-like predicted oxidoreductase